jgi:hypothetical protein
MADKKKAAPGTPEDPTDHSKSSATVGVETTDAASEEDQSLAGKILRSGLFFVRDHSTGEDYVGISPQNNPDASDASKLRSAVTPLGAIAPRTGMVIKPKDGPAFTIGEGFGPDSTPERWAGVTTPDGKPLFA